MPCSFSRVPVSYPVVRDGTGERRAAMASSVCHGLSPSIARGYRAAGTPGLSQSDGDALRTAIVELLGDSPR